MATLPRLQEEKFSDNRHAFRDKNISHVSSVPHYPLVPNSNPLSSLLPSPPKKSPLPFKRLSPEERAVHREKGICFNYDEKFSHGHKCSSKLFLLIADEEDVP